MNRSFQINGLSLKFGSTRIFDDVNLNFDEGSFNTILGPSGAGKTQLLRTLASLNDPIVQSPIKKRSCSFVFQNGLLLPWLSIFDNLKISTRCSDEKILSSLEHYQMIEAKDQRPAQISMGMQQKINLLRAFLSPSELILLDEPFASLDHANKSALHIELLKLWQNEKKTILFVTHDIDEALKLSQEIFLFSKKMKNIFQSFKCSFSYPRSLQDEEFKEFYFANYKLIDNFLLQDFK